MIQSIEADGPAYNSELTRGDIIIGFADKKVSSIDDLHKYLDETSISQKVDLLILRNRRKMRVRVIPAELK